MARCQHSKYGWCDDCTELDTIRAELDEANREIARLRTARKVTPTMMNEPIDDGVTSDGFNR